MSTLNNDLRLRDLEKRMGVLEEELFGPPNPDPERVAKYRAEIARKALMCEEVPTFRVRIWRWMREHAWRLKDRYKTCRSAIVASMSRGRRS